MRDTEEAAEWLEAAAKAKSPEAQFRLGVMFEEGKGAPRSAKDAVKW